MWADEEREERQRKTRHLSEPNRESIERRSAIRRGRSEEGTSGTAKTTSSSSSSSLKKTNPDGSPHLLRKRSKSVTWDDIAFGSSSSSSSKSDDTSRGVKRRKPNEEDSKNGNNDDETPPPSSSSSTTTTTTTPRPNTSADHKDRYFDDVAKRAIEQQTTDVGGAGSFEPDDNSDFYAAFEPESEFKHWEVGERYKLDKILGKGSYGEVAEALDLKRNGVKVAIKRMPDILEDETDAKRMFREIYILRRLNHKHVCHLVDIIRPPAKVSDFRDVYMVFEFLDTDLYKLIQSPQYLTTPHVQSFLYQLLCGVKHIHSAAVIHRDLKPANILLNEDCTLKICDFGLSRVVDLEKARAADAGAKGDGRRTVPNSPMAPATPDIRSNATTMRQPKLRRALTQHVVTRWYRAPELILLQDYDGAVDMWSIGCIFAELLSMQRENVPDYHRRKALFPGKSCFPLTAEKSSPSTFTDDRDQLNLIMSVIGTPSDEDIAAFKSVEDYLRQLEPKQPKDFLKTWPRCDRNAIDLLKRMLAFNPKKRITVTEALDHPYLKSARKAEDEAPDRDVPIEFPRLRRKMSSAEIKRIVHREILDFCDAMEQRESAATKTSSSSSSPEK